MKVNKYLIFAGDSYYARGGWLDFLGSVDTEEEALDVVKKADDWWHIVDTELCQIIAAKDGSYCGRLFRDD